MKAKKNIYFFDSLRGKQVRRKIPYGADIIVGKNISKQAFNKLFPSGGSSVVEVEKELVEELEEKEESEELEAKEEKKPKKKRGRPKKREL